MADLDIQNQKIINSAWYTATCLHEVFCKMGETNSKDLFIFYHASSHTSHATNWNLKIQKIDLMVIDFFLFPAVEKKLHGHQFSSPEEAVAAIKTHVLQLSSSDSTNCFER